MLNEIVMTPDVDRTRVSDGENLLKRVGLGVGKRDFAELCIEGGRLWC